MKKGMRLEMASYEVRDLRFGGATAYADGVLTVHPEEIRRVALGNGDFADVRVEIARPGESVRIIHVMDAAEPRFKPDGPDFPGFLSLPRTAGEGRTHRLAGAAVVSAGGIVAGEPTFRREGIIDMCGPGAEASPLGRTCNLVLEFLPASADLDATQEEAEIRNVMRGSALAQRYARKVRSAELRVAAHLARTTATLAPSQARVYELARPAFGGLPRVVYFFQAGWLDLYGETIGNILPTLLHPNEILDGCLVGTGYTGHASYRVSTYLNQNQAIISELYDHHGTDLDFAGVVIYPAESEDIETKERMAEYAVKLARLLGAEGAVSSYLGGGHPCVEFMLICQKCEHAGIPVVQVMPESYGTPEDPGFVYCVPESVAIVSTGRATARVKLPPMERVIGGDRFFNLPESPLSSLEVPYLLLYGCTSNTGGAFLTARSY